MPDQRYRHHERRKKDEKGEQNNRDKISLLFKLSGTFAVLLIITIVTLAFLSIRDISSSSLNTAVMMGREKLKGDINTFGYKLTQEYGGITLQGDTLVSGDGMALKGRYKIVDEINEMLNVHATIFMKEGNDYRRMSTSIKDDNGNRVVDTLLGTQSAAYAPIQAGNDYFGNAVILGKNYLTAYRPLFAPNSRDVIGILFIGIEMSSINSSIQTTINTQTVTILGLAVILLLISVVATIVICRIIIIKPIKSVMAMLKDMGEGDLTERLPAKSRDEIGEMETDINIAMEKIETLIIAIKNKTELLTSTGHDLTSSMSETAAAMNEITANMESVKTRVMNQGASVLETNETMEKITKEIDVLNEEVDEEASSVSKSSSAIEQMLANVQSVTNTLIKNAENVHELSTAAEVGRSGLQAVSQDIQEIAKNSEGLLEINTVMENIASQTNLLSMNAAIEAAHAGEAGKGFAVVAGEIRKLAESSSNQSKTIAEVLKKIKESIDKITRSTNNVLEKFQDINTDVGIVTDQEENIRNAMEEQGQGSKQILDAISQLNSITQKVKDGSTNMRNGSKEVIAESKNLERVTEEITGSMEEMALGVEQINKAMNRVNDISYTNRNNIDALNKEVDKFKVA